VIFLGSKKSVKSRFLGGNKMLKRRFIDIGIIIEDERGYHKIAMQNGDVTFLTFPFKNNSAKVGDKGNVYYESCSSYGMNRFEIDNSVNIDFEKMRHNYKNKWNGELVLSKEVIK